MAKQTCRGCKGLKKVWGAGTMVKYDCRYCDGTGTEDTADIDKILEPVVEEFKVVDKAIAPEKIAPSGVKKAVAKKKK